MPGKPAQTTLSHDADASQNEPEEHQVVPQTTVLPKGARVILPMENITPEVKKARSQKQIESYKKMRQALDESREKRKFSRKEALEKIDEIAQEERRLEAEAAQQKADELKAQGIDVVVHKRRGRKPGEKIPYGGKPKEESQEEILRRVVEEAIQKGMRGEKPPTMNYPHDPAHPNSNISVSSPPLSEVYKNQSQTAPAPVENPYLAMIRRKKR
jgi:hypothetical protein